LAASICEDIGDSMLSEEINLLNQGIEQLPDGYYNALAGQLASQKRSSCLFIIALAMMSKKLRLNLSL
ncbi:hypothetical protein ACSNNV_16700, partial [Faecalibacterium prausnitzii]|uniref:hypothetical protein n=1 Tax=Faecalibacterium prausnitzii TaxID=853 RepID=UPI003F1CB6BE